MWWNSGDAFHRVLDRVRRSGEVWMGATEWNGRQAIRISVSSWATTEKDIERAIMTFVIAAAS